MKLFVAAVIAAVCLQNTFGQVNDLTKVSGAKGSDVVEAVINLIHEYCIFPNDRLYLRRIAYVESQDGVKDGTFRPGYYGGIWQVDENQFRLTQTAAALSEARSKIQSNFAINWSAVRWQDLTKPLYSGLAAALYALLNAGANGIPSRVENQGAFWVNTTTHTIGEAHDFLQSVGRLNSGCKRSTELDLVFVVDSSTSLSPSDLEVAKVFIKDVVDQFDIGTNQVQVAVVEYSTAVAASFLLNSHPTKAEVKKAVEGIGYNPGGTNTAEALDYSVNTVFNVNNGARKGVSRVLILITDGRSDKAQDTLTAASRAKQQGITIFTIGVTPLASREELSNVASRPACTHSQLLNAFSDLDSLKNEIQRVSCTAPAVLTPNNYSFACGNDVTVQVLPDLAAGTTVTIDVSDGTVSIYGSLTSSNPSQVLNEFSKISETSIPVTFYIRGNRTVSLALVSSRSAGAKSCNSNFKVNVEKGNNIRPVSNLLCIENGMMIRNCSANTLFQSPFMIVPKPYRPDLPNVCRNVGQVEIYEYTFVNDRFIYCDGRGNTFVVLCPVRMIFDLAYAACIPGAVVTVNPPTVMLSTLMPATQPTPVVIITPAPSQGPGLNIGVNPCTPDNLVNGLYFFPYPGDEHAYIECFNLPYVAVVKYCSANHYWDQPTLTCLYKPVVVDPTIESYNLGIGKPCGSVPDLFFYPYPNDVTRYIHCDQYGDAFEKVCPDNKIWNQAILQCIPKGVYIDNLNGQQIPFPGPLGKK